MVSTVGYNTRSYFVYQALKYLQNEPGDTADKSFAEISKNAVGAVPLNFAFTEVPRVWEYMIKKDGKVAPGLFATKDAAGNIKGLGSLTKGYGNLFKNIKSVEAAVGQTGFVSDAGNVLLKKINIKDLFSAKGLKNGYDYFEAVKGAENIGKGIKDAGEAITKATTNGKGIKGFFSKNCGPWMFAISGAFELMEIVPAFAKGGFEEGMKQVGKSLAKVGVSGVAYAAGGIAGNTVGAVIGGVIGSIIPGAGTAVGAWLGGLIGGPIAGMIASSTAEKYLKKATGKSFKEEQAEKEKQQQAEQIAQDANATNELAQAVATQLAQKQQSGKKLTKNDISMAQSLQDSGALNNVNPFNTGAMAAQSVPAATDTTATVAKPQVQSTATTAPTQQYQSPALKEQIANAQTQKPTMAEAQKAQATPVSYNYTVPPEISTAAYGMSA